MKVKCLITRYDSSIKKAPFLTVLLGACEVEKPENDNLGEIFYYNMNKAVTNKGFALRFWTLASNETLVKPLGNINDYYAEIVVE